MGVFCPIKAPSSQPKRSQIPCWRLALGSASTGEAVPLTISLLNALWRSVKYERIYLMDHVTGFDLDAGLSGYFRFYNVEGPHQSLGYRTPKEVHCA